MSIAALIGLVAFAIVAVGWRAWLQWRRTGDTGLRGIGGSPVEILAGGVLALGAGTLIAAAIADLLGFLDPIRALDHWFVSGLGVMLLLAGAALTVRAQLDMGDSWRVGVDGRETTELIRTGVFRKVRNPIFSGMIAASFGVALMVPSALAWLGVILVVGGLQLQVRKVEEPYLERVHGDGYHGYAREAGRFIPRVGRHR